MILAIDKPSGITSFGVIYKIRKTLPHKIKIWHSGTLDPTASGLMFAWVQREWTRLLGQLQKLDKTYITTIDLSISTDTRDVDFWEYFEQHDVTWNQSDGFFLSKNGHNTTAPKISEIKEKLDVLIPQFCIPLTPFSAKKKNWQKLYDLARSGNPILEDKIMITHSYEILEYNFPILKLELNVWSGTYIRSIGNRLGTQFGLWWTLTELRRTKIWKFKLSSVIFDQEIENIKYKEIEIGDII